jgi:hypothetical protein
VSETYDEGADRAGPQGGRRAAIAGMIAAAVVVLGLIIWQFTGDDEGSTGPEPTTSPTEQEPTAQPTEADATTTGPTAPAPTPDQETTSPAATGDQETTAATGTSAPTPTQDDEGLDEEEDTATPTAGGPAWIDPGEDMVGEPWPGGGPELFAPTVRAGLNDGFDRVVLDITGPPDGEGPGWLARWTEEVFRDGSGLPAEVAGDAFLEVIVSGMAMPEPGDPVYEGGDFWLDTHRLDGVYEVLRTPPFEGQLQLVVGVAGEPRPYRVFLLQDPMRLVVDVRHAD